MKTGKLLFLMLVGIVNLLLVMPMNSYANEIINKSNSTSNTEEQTNILGYINGFRSSSKVPVLQSNPKLQDAAKNHNQYMLENKVFSHQQEKGKKYFKGVYPLDRAAYFGYEYPFVIEYIQNNSENYVEVIDQLMNNPYTRVSLLNPNYIHIGMNSQSGTYTFELGGKKADQESIVVYPSEEQIKAPIKWKNDYEIDPFRKSTDKRVMSGYPITFSYFSNKDITEFKVNVDKVSLTNKNTQETIPVMINTPDNDEYLIQSLLIIPLSYLEKNAEYEVNVEVDVAFKDSSTQKISKTWNFSTSEEQSVTDQIQDLEGHWGKEQIQYLLDKNIASPKQEQLFMPNQYITREEFVEMAVRAMNLKIQNMEKSVFRDVPMDSDYADYIFTAYKNQIVNGYTRTTFKPEDVVTREQIVTILMRMYNQMLNRNYKTIDVSLSKSFTDIEQTSSWARAAVLAAKELDLIQGREDGRFHPKKNTTRAEAATMIYRFIQYIEVGTEQ